MTGCCPGRRGAGSGQVRSDQSFTFAGATIRSVPLGRLLKSQPLAVRVVGDQRLQLADQVGVAAEREVGFDPLLERRQV